jgi:transcriptional regulator with XRE-family HTH domain
VSDFLVGKRPERSEIAVKTRREELVVTQEALADKAGVHRTYLSNIERGSRNVSLLSDKEHLKNSVSY